MAYEGMDVDEIERLGRGLRERGTQLVQLLARVDQVVGHGEATWQGTDAEQFAHAWRRQGRPALVAASHAVTGLGDSALANAAQQRAVSSAGRGGSGTGRSYSGHHESRELDLLNLSHAAYGDYGGELSGYRRLAASDLTKLGITPGALDDPASGFHAEVFVDPKGNYVVSYRGTEPWTVDVGADVEGGVYLSRQSELAAVLALSITGSVGADQVTFTGHSLGGRLAAVASVATGAYAVTYNAAGVSNSELTYAMTVRGQHVGLLQYGLNLATLGLVDTYGGARQEVEGQIRNYYADNDPLTLVQSVRVGPSLELTTGLPQPLGEQVSVHDPKSNGAMDHSLDAIERGLRAEHRATDRGW